MSQTSLIPVDDPDSAIGAGWFIEVDGRCVAELAEPMYVSGSQFWYSYVIVPLTTNSQEKDLLFSQDFWVSGKAVFRSRKFGVVAPNALPASAPPSLDTHRIMVRGLHIQIDFGPSLIEKAAGFFKKLFQPRK
jgi:hypothetical protein